jgi:hypothetical protein
MQEIEMTEQEAKQNVEALIAGRNWVQNLKAGDPFTGTLPEADKRYPTDEINAAIFSSSAYRELKGYKLFTDGGLVSHIEKVEA